MYDLRLYVPATLDYQFEVNPNAIYKADANMYWSELT